MQGLAAGPEGTQRGPDKLGSGMTTEEINRAITALGLGPTFAS